MPRRPYTPLQAEVIRLADRRNVGVCTTEIDGYTRRQVGRAVEHLLYQKRIHRGKASHRVVRFFGHREDAEAFADAALLARGGVNAPARQLEVAPWAADAKPHFPVDGHGVPTWKFTQCPPSQIGLHRTNTHAEW